MAITDVLILGYGAFGEAIHQAVSSRTDLRISVFARSRGIVRPIQKLYRNPAEVALRDFDIVIIALPSFAIAENLAAMNREGSENVMFISCAKGIDRKTHQFPSQTIIAHTGSSLIAVISGASFASEMLKGQPVYLSLACQNQSLGKALIRKLQTPLLRLELVDDVRGLEVAAIGKNIVALGAGIVDGLGMGLNFRAAFIARGIIELRHAIRALGGNEETLISIGALGDVVLTSSSDQSRNYKAGQAASRGGIAGGELSEGRLSIQSFLKLLSEHGFHSRYFSAVESAMDDPHKILQSMNVTEV